MAKFWLTYMDMVEVLMLNYHSLRSQLWDDYLTSVHLMMPWKAAYNHLHYTRYLVHYWASMVALDIEVRVNSYCVLINYIMAARITMEKFTNRIYYTDAHKENTQVDAKPLNFLMNI